MPEKLFGPRPTKKKAAGATPATSPATKKPTRKAGDLWLTDDERKRAINEKSSRARGQWIPSRPDWLNRKTR